MWTFTIRFTVAAGIHCIYAYNVSMGRLERCAAVGTASAAAAPNFTRELPPFFLACVVDRFSASVVAASGVLHHGFGVLGKVRAPGLYWRVRFPFPARAIAFPSLVLQDRQSQRRLSGAPFDSSPSM